MEHSTPKTEAELKEFDLNRARNLRAVLRLVWPDIPSVAGNGMTLGYFLELEPDAHPVNAFQEYMGGSPEALEALVADMANYPKVIETTHGDYYKSIELSLQIAHRRLEKEYPDIYRNAANDHNQRKIVTAANNLADAGKPVSRYLYHGDLDQLDPFYLRTSIEY